MKKKYGDVTQERHFRCYAGNYPYEAYPEVIVEELRGEQIVTFFLAEKGPLPSEHNWPVDYARNIAHLILAAADEAEKMNGKAS